MFLKCNESLIKSSNVLDWTVVTLLAEGKVNFWIVPFTDTTDSNDIYYSAVTIDQIRNMLAWL